MIKKILILIILLSSFVSAEQVYLLNLNYDKGEITLKDKFVKNGFAPDYNLNSGDYQAEIISSDNIRLYEVRFDIPLFIYSDRSDSFGEVSGDVIKRDIFDFTLVVPYFNNGKEINIYYKNERIFNTKVSSIQKSPVRNVLIYIILGILVLGAIFFVILKKKRKKLN
jgi:hypothetical protein